MRQSNFLEMGLYLLLYQRYSGLEEERDVYYKQGGKRTYLDIIREKESGSALRPLFIYIHGGGWVSGLRKARRFYCRHWAKRGFVCANIGYDYALDARHPEHIRQIFSGIEYVLKNAARYGIDPSRIVVAGESAGGYFAALVAAVASHHVLYDLLGISFDFKDSFKISATVLISGIFDPIRSLGTKFPNMELFVQAFTGLSVEEAVRRGAEMRTCWAPSYYADVQFPPSFIIGAARDKLLPESVALHQELGRAGVHNALYVCKGVNSVHAGALACHFAAGKKADQQAAAFIRALI